MADTGAFALFDDSFRRALASSSSLSGKSFSRGGRKLQLQEEVPGCVCPIDLDPIEPDAPSEEEFLGGFDEAVRSLNEEGAISSVAGVAGIE